MTQTLDFSLPANQSAAKPPELRAGGQRDKVRLLVLNRRTGKVIHSRFRRIADFLAPGDLLVFNASRTLPVFLTGCREPDKSKVEVRLASHLPDNTWLALLHGAPEPEDCACCAERTNVISFGLGLSARLESRHREIPGLWKMRFSVSGPALIDLFYRLGEPVRYGHIAKPWDLNYYQTVYARDPGSAEMPSAGRAFTWKTLLELRKKGVETAYLTLHTGLSSYLDDEVDARHLVVEEEYKIDQDAALKIEAARVGGRRIVAVGTTVVRALESTAQADGVVRATHGYTGLLITPDYRLQVANGILTGLHEPAASHLGLLSAFISPALLHQAYLVALRFGYLWHEFGDLNLIF